jgi:hypothetical protein
VSERARQDLFVDVADEYVRRCWRAGDQRPLFELLREIVDASFARTLARALEQRWVI